MNTHAPTSCKRSFFRNVIGCRASAGSVLLVQFLSSFFVSYVRRCTYQGIPDLMDTSEGGIVLDHFLEFVDRCVSYDKNLKSTDIIVRDEKEKRKI